MAKKSNGKLKTFLRKHFRKHKLTVLLALTALVLVAICTQTKAEDQSVGKTFSDSTLMEAINIQELSTSQFNYNGIAKVYRKNNKDDVKCYIKYKATVKAGINMEDVDIKLDDSDEDNKKVYITLPEIKIYKPNVDESSFSYIKKNTLLDRKDLELKDVIKACIKDAKTEAKKSKELKQAAKDNLKVTIEGLVKPLIEDEGYTIEWKG